MNIEQVGEKGFAPESDKILRARRKLEERANRANGKFSQQAKQKALEDIHRRIANNAAHRLPLKGKEIALFDKNQNPALASQKVAKVMRALQTT